MALHTRHGPRALCCRFGSRVRKVKSRGALLVLVWSFLVWASTYFLAEFFNRRLQLPTAYSSNRLGYDILTVIAVFCPVGGWLADVYFGRYKVVRVSLQMMWLASVIATAAMTVQYSFPETTTALNYGILLPMSLIFSSGLSAYIANAVPFGTDQMLEASGEEISAFIYWFIWTWYAGRSAAFFLNLIYDCSTLSDTAADLVLLITVVATMSLALILDYLFQDSLIDEPESRNPLKTVIRVLKYAATHKYPERRSALTYWEEDIPSRIDLGKSKYGGPFTTEQVEDVKTFLRILAVIIVSTSVIGMVGQLAVSMANHFQEFRGLSLCQADLAAFGYFYPLVIVLSIPLYEFLIYPLARHWIPSMLKKFGIGATLIVILNLFLFTMDTVGHSENRSVPCIFMANESSPVMDINYLWVQVSSALLTGLSDMLCLIALFEFTCAQTPYAMKGLLTGIAWSALSLSGLIGTLIYIVWTLSWKAAVTFPSCGFWYFLFTTVLATVSLMIFILTAKWYSKRERDERPYDQAIVEDVYDRYCIQSSRPFLTHVGTSGEDSGED